MIRSKFVWTMIVVVSVSIAALFTSTANALCPGSCQHPSSGRDHFRGYYTNNPLPINSPDPTTHGAFWRLPDAPWTVNSAPSFSAFIQSSLFDTSNGSINDRTAAASYIVNAMMGHKGTDFGGSILNGVNTARSEFPVFQQRIQDYEDANLIVWDDTMLECPGDVQANLDYIAHESYTFSNIYITDCIPDVAMTFRSPVDGSVLFQIKVSCGNPIGDNDPLPPITPPPYGTVNPPTPGNPLSTPPAPVGYNTGDPNTYSSCHRTTGTAHDPANNAYSVPITVTYSGGASGTRTGNSLTTSPYRFDIDTPASVKNAINPVTATVRGLAADGSTFPIGSITFGPCLLANPVCGAMNLSPTSIDPGTPFTVTTVINYGTPLEAATVRAQPGFRYFITITGPAGYNFNANVGSTGPGSTNTITGAVSRPATGNTGTYVVGWGITTTSGFGNVNCGSAIPLNPTPPTFDVTNKPYFKVNGGDISAGAGMSTGGLTCAAGGVSPNSEASIVSWNRGAAGGYGGAGTQYGALALKHLLGFVSGQGSSYAPSRLSFGNTGAADQVDLSRELYGGQFGSTACTADYFANANGTLMGNRTLSSILGVPTGSTYTVANGDHRTIYVDGAVRIDVNVVFTGIYPNTAAIPSFAVVVKGNIYVDPGIQTLDGFYIAQPSSGGSSDGIIYTCAPLGFGTNAVNVLTSGLQANCSNALTVTGAFVARQVWLLRTAGTVSGSTAAETFNYSPEVWLSTPFGTGLNPPTTDTYDSITSLPPVL